MIGLKTALLRLVGGGMLCGAVLCLGQKDGQREILRFGCACIMIVVLLTAFRGLQLPTLSVSAYEADLRQTVSEAMAENRDRQLAEVAQTIGTDIVRQAAVMELQCSAQASCEAAADGSVTVRSVEISYFSGTRQRLQELQAFVRDRYGVTEGQIVIREGG